MDFLLVSEYRSSVSFKGLHPGVIAAVRERKNDEGELFKEVLTLPGSSSLERKDDPSYITSIDITMAGETKNTGIFDQPIWLDFRHCVLKIGEIDLSSDTGKRLILYKYIRPFEE